MCKSVHVYIMWSDLKKALVAHCETSLSQAALEQARIRAVAQACSSCTEQINNSNIYCVCLTCLHTDLRLHALILCEGYHAGCRLTVCSLKPCMCVVLRLKATGHDKGDYKILEIKIGLRTLCSLKKRSTSSLSPPAQLTSR